jgi:hypothetical protein
LIAIAEFVLQFYIGYADLVDQNFGNNSVNLKWKQIVHGHRRERMKQATGNCILKGKFGRKNRKWTR